MKSEFDDLIGKPFKEYGRGPDAYDCWGIVVESGRRIGEQTPDYSDLTYGSNELWETVKAALPEYDEIPKREKRKGDIVLFKNIDGSAHFGRMIDNRMLITCNIDLGVHTCSAEGFLESFIKGFYRCRSK